MKKEVHKKEVQKKEVGFITVINIIVGIIIAIFFVLTLIMGLYLVSAFFLILAVFIFLPQKILKFSKWLKLLIGVIGFFVLLAIVGLIIPPQEQVFESYTLNESFILVYEKVNFSMIIYNATKEDKVLIDGTERISEGTFIKINGALTNLEHTASDFGVYSSLIDNQNNTYTVLGYNFGEGALQPNLKRNFFYIFEIPKDASGLKFTVTEDNKNFKSIDLGI